MRHQRLASQSPQSLPSHFQTELFYLTAHSFLRCTVCAEFTYLSLLNIPSTLPPSLFKNLLVLPHSTWNLSSLQESNPLPLHQKCDVSATRLPGSPSTVTFLCTRSSFSEKPSCHQCPFIHTLREVLFIFPGLDQIPLLLVPFWMLIRSAMIFQPGDLLLVILVYSSNITRTGKPTLQFVWEAMCYFLKESQDTS